MLHLSQPSAPRRLRELLAGPDILAIPGAFSPLSARLVEEAGFPTVYMTGSGAAADIFGVPDIGLLTMTETASLAHSFAEAVRIPIIADADTGYGNAISVIRTVRAFEKSGVAGIHLEDQVMPKRCGHLEGKRLVHKDEMVGKLRAACDARRDPNFLIIGRCDAIGVESLDSAFDRGRAYINAGADVLWFDAPRSVAEIRAIADQFAPFPLLLNMSSSGKTPFLTVREVGAIGFRIMLFPIYTLLAAIVSMRALLRDLRDSGDVNRVRAQCATFEEFNKLLGIDDIRGLETKYASSVIR
jgi:carboxyvinyl-carboxyphosphonate phosphorylmutase